MLLPSASCRLKGRPPVSFLVCPGGQQGSRAVTPPSPQPARQPPALERTLGTELVALGGQGTATTSHLPPISGLADAKRRQYAATRLQPEST